MSRYSLYGPSLTGLVLTELKRTYKSKDGRNPMRPLAENRLISTLGTRVDTKSRLVNEFAGPLERNSTASGIRFREDYRLQDDLFLFRGMRLGLVRLSYLNE